MKCNQNYMLISYASKDGKYLQYARKFKKQLKQLEIAYDITYLDNPTNFDYWIDEYSKDKIKKELICLQKPTLIINKLYQYKMPIICVDIDSQLTQKPVLPHRYFDNGFIFRKDRKLSVTNGFHVHNFTDNSLRFLKMWEYLCKYPEFTYLSDHHRLKVAIDLIYDENRARLNRKTVLLDVIDYYQNIYIEGLTRVDKPVEYSEISKSNVRKKTNFRQDQRVQNNHRILRTKNASLRTNKKRFNILLCRMDRSSLYGNQRDAFQESLKKYADVCIVTNKLPPNISRSQYVNNIFSNNKSKKYLIPPKLNLNLSKFDCIFVDCEINMFFNENWKNINIPKFATIHDLHTAFDSVNFILNNNFDLIFTRYKNPLFKLLPVLKGYKKSIIWQPGCVNTNLFKDYKLSKNYDVVLSGVIGNSYPLRQKVKEYFNDYSYFTYINRPKDQSKNAFPVGEDYARLLNQSKISITDTSKYHYSLMKIYEITRSNSLLMMDSIDELKELGFISNKHYIPLSQNMRKNENVIEYYLNDDAQRQIISKNGYDLTSNKHNSDYRAKEFINILCDYYKIPRTYSNIGVNQYADS